MCVEFVNGNNRIPKDEGVETGELLKSLCREMSYADVDYI